MNRPTVLSAALLAAFTLMTGCTQRIGDFTLISTKNVDIGGKYKRLDGRYMGEDGKGMVIGIPLGIPSLKTAVDNCIEKGRGDLLTNAVLESSFWTFIIYGEEKYTVTGDVWVKAGTSDLLNPSINLYELQGTPRGYELVSLSDPSQRVKVDYLWTSR
jgi:hypothetical protein